MVERALEGLKVVDFSWVVVGPLASLYLAHHGATVIRVESVRRLDIPRTIPPYKDNIHDFNHTLAFDNYNSDKFGMTLNLAHPKGLELAKRLVAWGDIVGENFAPGVMERLGLGYEDLKKVKPDIIMYSTSNLGQTGPEARQPGLGVQLVSYAGFTHITGWPDRIAAQPYGAYTDFPAARLLVAAIMAAIEYHRRTGKGQYLDMSQMEVGLQFMAPFLIDYSVNKRIGTRDGNKCPYAAPHGAYPCQGDDRWCAISVFTDEEWIALCRVMGNPELAKVLKFTTLAGRKENEEELDQKLGEWTRRFTAEEVMETLQAVGVPAGVVKNTADVYEDTQLAHRHYFWQLEHPEIGMHHYEGTGYNMSKTPIEISMPAPLLGQHTEYICRDILGMSDEEFVDLFNQGVLE